jgi:cell filamentation protein
MSEGYKYLDSTFSYIDQSSGVLINLPGIQDSNDLMFFESVVVSSRIQELVLSPITVNSCKDLFEIHRFLFQDVYKWAGKIRTIEISKESKQFFPTTAFSSALNYIDSLIKEYEGVDALDKLRIAKSLANILDTVNYLHPFREGNGRAQREFVRSLALKKKYSLNLNPPDNVEVFEQYMKGTIESDVNVLTTLIFNQLIFLDKF